MWDAIQEFKRQSIFTIYTEWKNNWKYRYEITNSNSYKILYQISLVSVIPNICLKTPGSGEIFLQNMWKTLIFQELCSEKSKTVVLIFQYCRPGQVNRCNWRMTNAALLPFWYSAHFISIARLPRAGSNKTLPFKTSLGFWLLNGILTKTNSMHLLTRGL